MCKGIIGKKLGMTSLFMPDGRYVPVTVVQAGPCIVTQIKTQGTDGYSALQLGFGDIRESRVNKPLKGHLQKSKSGIFAQLKEFSAEVADKFELGQSVSVDIFEVGERVAVSGTTKGRGFAGVMKRHGFGGGRKTHGSRSHRIPGSIGCSAWPAKVTKGKKLPGHYGHTRHTIKNLEIVDIRPKENLLLIKGAVPGARQGILEINKQK